MAEPAATTDSSVTLRPAGPSDAPAVMGFIRELAAFERLSHEVVADEAALCRWLFGEHAAAEVVLAEIDGAPVGFALFFTTFSTFLGRPGIYLEDLYVTPARRSAGIGAKLLAHLATLAVERGYGRLEWSVLDWNERAIDFYRRLGARPMDEWTVNRLDGAALAALAGRAS